jgi:hypothetical protein
MGDEEKNESHVDVSLSRVLGWLIGGAYALIGASFVYVMDVGRQLADIRTEDARLDANQKQVIERNRAQDEQFKELIGEIRASRSERIDRDNRIEAKIDLVRDALSKHMIENHWKTK